jgi:hypothetical protein
LHSTYFFIYLCIKYLLAMYSILKIVPGIKVTLMLIIFGIGSIWLLEHKHSSGQKTFPDPQVIYHAGISPRGIPSRHLETAKPMQGNGNNNKTVARAGSAGSVSQVHNLGELGLHIEL